MKTQRHLVVLTQEDQNRLREVLSEEGEDATAETIGVSRIALLRGASGLGVLRGTRALIMGGLYERSPDRPQSRGVASRAKTET